MTIQTKFGQREQILQPETTDNLGYSKEEYDAADIPQVKEHLGPVSQSLISHTEIEPLIIQGLNSAGQMVEVRVSMSKGRFINAELMAFGFPTGKRTSVAYLSDNNVWWYPNNFRRYIEQLTPEDKDHWVAKIHTYFRT